MLIRFRVANHRSIREEQELSLVAGRGLTGAAAHPVPGSDERVWPVVAVLGANAAGKSNVISAMAYMCDAVAYSHSQAWPTGEQLRRRPFLLDEDSASRPSTFVAEFATRVERYEYGFSFTESAVEREWLRDLSEGEPRKLFERFRDRIDYGRGFPDRPVGRPRPNGLLVSAGAFAGHPALGPVYRYFRSSLMPMVDGGLDGSLPQRLSMTVAELSGVDAGPARRLLKLADPGITDLEIRALPAHDDLRRVTERLEAEGKDAELIEINRRLVAYLEAHPDSDSDEDPARPLLMPNRLSVVRRASPGAPAYRLPLDQESSGTKAWIGLVGPITHALREGAALAVDGLTARLRPDLAALTVGFFQSWETNPRGAQLILTARGRTLMDASSYNPLGREQIVVAEKEDRTGATVLFPQTEPAGLMA
jgi:uncharacterized protein